MDEAKVKVDIDNDVIKIALGGHIDSSNAETVKNEIISQIGDTEGAVIIDASDLEYISSAGLRILLQLRKKHPEMSVIEASPEIYDILDITGFNQMMDVSRAYRRITLDNCELIGEGANGWIYKTERDSVVKVYKNPEALDEIREEREIAKLALILGIPTAIPYDIVRVNDTYGAVYELLDAKSFSNILATEPERMDWCVDEYVELLKKIHGTEAPEGKLPDMKDTALSWANFMKDYLPEEIGTKLVKLVEDVPHTDHMLHGDYHTGNVELVGDEVLLIDMDTLAVGNPVFEFASIFNAFVGFHETNPGQALEFHGYDHKTAGIFFDKVIRAYTGLEDETALQDFVDKARIVGYTRLIRRSIRRKGLETEEGRREIDHWKEELIELVSRIDSLT